MPLPSLPLYQEAIQHPNIYLDDPKLKTCSVEVNLMGLPRVRSGGFALTYKLSSNGASWAVRCFHKSVPDREIRYQAISQFLRSNSSIVLVPVYYVRHGIKIQSNWYPITYMPWVEGYTLGTFIEKNFGNRQSIALISKDFCHLIKELERLGIAHGDLSGGNIIVQNNGLVLVDYDGMFVPQLKGKNSNEIGNINFQHPKRTQKDFNSELDRFSSIVIYLALEAIARKPSLWEAYGTGEGLLFSRSDFIDPIRSKLLLEIEQFSDLKPLVSKFRQICQTDLPHIPRLFDLIADRPVQIPVYQYEIPVHEAIYVSQYPVLDALESRKVLQNVGEKVVVVGQVDSIYQGRTRYGPKPGSPYLFINYGNWRSGGFTVVAWSEVLDIFNQIHRDPYDLEDKWVSTTGIITTYQGRPQIILESPKEIEIISGEAEARERRDGYQRYLESTQERYKQPQRLKKTQTPRIPTKTPTQSLGNRGKEDQSRKLEELYAGKLQAGASSSTSKKSSKTASTLTRLYSSTPSSTKRGGTHPLSQTKSDSVTDPKQKYKKFAYDLKIPVIIILILSILYFLSYFVFSKQDISNSNSPRMVSTAPINNSSQENRSQPGVIGNVSSKPTQTFPVEITTLPKQAPALRTITGCLTGNLKVRSGPGEDFGIAYWLTKETCLSFDGRSSESFWIHIKETNEFRSGWVSSKWVKLDDNIEELPILPNQ
jgi:serine/threonine protein kinase